MTLYPLSANMKILRAQEHFEALETVIARWLDPPPYTVTIKEDVNQGIYLCNIAMHIAPNDIPKILGDFICNLRSSLEHIAWQLSQLPPKRTFTKSELKRICFPVFEQRDRAYENLRGLFPPAVANVIDDLQPFNRGAAFPDHPLWQLHKLWNLDKHCVIPVSPTSMEFSFPHSNWQAIARMRVFEDHLEVRFPLRVAWESPVKFEPKVSIKMLFGEADGEGLIVSWVRLREIYDFVRHDAIPRFATFFADAPASAR